MKITWSHVRTALIILFALIAGIFLSPVLAFLVVNGKWYVIFGAVIWIGVILGAIVIGEITKGRLSKRLALKIKKADADEQKREDEVLLQAVAFSQSVSFFMTALLLDGSLRLVTGAMTALFAVTFYIFRAWAKIKNSPWHRWVSMLILGFVVASTLMAIFAMTVSSLLLLTPIAFDFGINALVPFVFGIFGASIGDATSNMFKKRYGAGENTNWKLIIKNLIHQW